jgi:hypothetical protein
MDGNMIREALLNEGLIYSIMQGDAAASNNLTHVKGKEIITFTGNRMKEIEAATTTPLKNECLIKFFTGVLLVTHLGATTTYEEVQMQSL